jgi:hypothetical protein
MTLIRSVVAILVFAAASASLWNASTLGWGSATSADGTRLKVSPIGLSHVLRPDLPVSRTVDCRFLPGDSGMTPCAQAPGSSVAFTLLTLVLPLVRAAVLFCALGALSSVAGSHRSTRLQAWCASLGLATALGSLALFAYSAPRALLDLNGQDFGVGGSRGTMQVAAAAAVLAGFAITRLAWPASTRDARARGLRWATGSLLLLCSLAAFLLMFPALGGSALALTSVGAGLLLGFLSTSRENRVRAA